AVVAEEVRSLAQRSAEAARSTADLIQQAVKNSDNGVEISQEVADVLEKIATGNRKVNDLINEIAAASAEQSQGIEQVNAAVCQMEQMTQQNAASAEESASAAAELQGQAMQVDRAIRELQAVLHGGAGKSGNRIPKPRAEFRPQHAKSPRSHKTPTRPATHGNKKPQAASETAEDVFPLEDKELTEF
ncbi:MAG: methyl-accepting chemotaxis protein, partial [Phycisphaerae bacterium]|nr:methyl-accepting chemotaxis protein [Phycisphaerae bacterium]